MDGQNYQSGENCGSDSKICYGYAGCIGYVVLCGVIINMLFYARIIYLLFMHITYSGTHSYDSYICNIGDILL